jgi:ABC-2 type transport system permease protein
MRNIWVVFKHEYTRQVLRKRFIMVLLTLPLIVLLSGGVGVLAVVVMMDNDPVGYVDQSGLLSNPVSIPQTASATRTVEILPFTNNESAQKALEEGKIQGYYVVSADYLATGKVTLVAIEQVGENALDDFSDFLRANLVKDLNPKVAERLTKGSNIEVRALEDVTRKTGDNDWINLVFPLVMGIILMMAVNTSGGYLLQAVVEEKENRTMEIVITSISPDQLMAGKILGNLSVGLTQLLVWFAVPMGMFFGVRPFIPFLKDINLGGSYVWMSLAALPAAFVLVASLMAMAGAVATESREAQQVAGLFTLPLFMPYWLISLLIHSPNSALAVGMSLFPMTAPVTLPARAAFTVIPTWQIVLSLGLLYVSAIGALWLAGRAFRLGMLQYGKRLKFAELFRRQEA